MNPTCVRGHEMEISSKSDSKDQKGYTCERCETQMQGEHWRCQSCLGLHGADYCFSCSPKYGNNSGVRILKILILLNLERYYSRLIKLFCLFYRYRTARACAQII